MKKTIFTLAIVLGLASCSKNDNLFELSSVALKTPATLQHGGDTTFDLTTYNYDSDGTLLSWVDSATGFTHQFTSDGNKFVERTIRFGGGGLHSRATYEYEGDLLVKSLHYDFDNELSYTSTYEYDSNGLPISYKYQFEAGAVSTWDIEYMTGTNSIKTTQRENPDRYDITTFDNYKSPYYNIPQWRTLQIAVGNLNANNKLEVQRYSLGVLSSVKTNTNTYDDDGFLLSTIHDDGNSIRTYEFTYNE